MSSPDLVVRSERIVTPEQVIPGAVVIRGGRIAEVAAYGTDFGEYPVVDAGAHVVMPGIVDTHVHVNEPGRTEWEGYATATRAAAKGGVTTLIDMPLNSVPATTTRAALAEKRAAAAGQCAIDVGFWGGVVPGNRDQLAGLIDDGVMGFKCFLIDSGVAEFEHVGERDARAALAILGESRVPLLVHAELSGPIDAAALRLTGADPRRYATYLASRPPQAEEQAIALMVELCRETRAPVHIVHHSAAGALPLVAAARDQGLSLTAETCPHYLHFAAEDIPDGATEFKCAPPIRDRANRDALWNALADGVLDMVVSDHSPCTAGLKARDQGDFMSAWGGVSSLQLTLPVVASDLRARAGAALGAAELVALSRWMSSRPARLAGLHGQKGAIAPGFDADLVIWDPDAPYQVDAGALEHRNKITPYHGETLWGVVHETYLRGGRVYRRGQDIDPRHGRLCRRNAP